MLKKVQSAILTSVATKGQLGLCASYTCEAKQENFCPRVAVVLSGCGVYDGSEVHEVVHLLSHLTRSGALTQCFAPNMKQREVVNHLTGETCKQDCRNALVESARIARGNVLPLAELIKNEKCFEAVIFPGGFGVAKNLSDFAVNGAKCTVIPDVVCILKCFQEKKKPIGLCCIAPVLAARVLCKPTLTLGKDVCDGKWPYASTIKEVEKMGAQHEPRDVHQVSFDVENQLFSTPAYMYAGAYYEIDDGIGNLVTAVINAIKLQYK